MGRSGTETVNRRAIIIVLDGVGIGEALEELPNGFLFANLVDFDQSWGHRNDVPGFYEGLRAFHRVLPALESALREDDLLFLTADHGNDPTIRGRRTSFARELTTKWQ